MLTYEEKIEFIRKAKAIAEQAEIYKDEIKQYMLTSGLTDFNSCKLKVQRYAKKVFTKDAMQAMIDSGIDNETFNQLTERKLKDFSSLNAEVKRDILNQHPEWITETPQVYALTFANTDE